MRGHNLSASLMIHVITPCSLRKPLHSIQLTAEKQRNTMSPRSYTGYLLFRRPLASVVLFHPKPNHYWQASTTVLPPYSST